MERKEAQSCELRIEAKPPLAPNVPQSVLAVIHETAEEADMVL